MLINPMWFYLADVLDTLKYAGLLMGVILLCVYLIFIYIESATGEDMRKQRRTSFILMVICTVVFIFSPSKTTVTEIIIASQITTENAETAKEVVDYVIEKINDTKGE